MTEKARLVLALVLIFGIVLPLGATIKNKWPAYWAEYNFKSLEKVYLASQYVSTDPSGWIPDEAIYSYAAGAYLQGANPILVDPSQPPLGKYILAFFIHFFNREKLAVLVFGFLAVFLFFLLAKMVLGDSLWALWAVFLLIMERLFVEQFIYVPLLDIFQLTFIFLAVIFFIKALANPRFFFGASLALGLVAATKFWVTALVIFLSWLFFLIFIDRDKKKIGWFLASLPIGFLPWAGSYWRFFQEGGSLRGFFGVQKWILAYHGHKVSSPFSVWRLIFFNQWPTWWGEKKVIPSPQWQISWPISVFGALLVSLGYFLKKKPFWGDFRVGVIITWILLYLLFLSVAQISPRYLIPLLPFAHLVSVYGVKRAWERK